jgi:hypothetical protein
MSSRDNGRDDHSELQSRIVAFGGTVLLVLVVLTGISTVADQTDQRLSVNSDTKTEQVSKSSPQTLKK